MLHLKADLLGTLCPQAPRLQLTDKQANKQGPKKHQVPFAFRRKEKQYSRIGFAHQCLVMYGLHFYMYFKIIQFPTLYILLI